MSDLEERLKRAVNGGFRVDFSTIDAKGLLSIIEAHDRHAADCDSLSARLATSTAIAEDFNHQRVEAARQRDQAAAAERERCLSVIAARIIPTADGDMANQSDRDVNDALTDLAAAIRANAHKEG